MLSKNPKVIYCLFKYIYVYFKRSSWLLQLLMIMLQLFCSEAPEISNLIGTSPDFPPAWGCGIGSILFFFRWNVPDWLLSHMLLVLQNRTCSSCKCFCLQLLYSTDECLKRDVFMFSEKLTNTLFPDNHIWFLNLPAYPQSHMAARYTTIALCPEDNVHCCAEDLTTQYPPNTFTLLIITQHASLSSTESPSLCPSTPAPLLTCMLVFRLQTATVWSSFLALNLSGLLCRGSCDDEPAGQRAMAPVKPCAGGCGVGTAAISSCKSFFVYVDMI